MKAKKCWILAAVVIFCVTLLSMKVLGIRVREEAQHELFGVSTLKGLDRIEPQVQLHYQGEVELDSLLTQNELQTRVEIALRKAGLNLPKPNQTESTLNSGALIIMVGVKSMRIKGAPLFYFAVRAELLQGVRLVRDVNIRTIGRTWPFIHIPDPMIAGQLVLREEVNRMIDYYVNEFINDYLAANPRDKQKSEDKPER